MKKLFTLITFIIFSFTCLAQNAIRQKPVIKFDDDLNHYVKVGYPGMESNANSAFDGMLTEPLVIEPGSSPEGDLPYKIRYSNDGQKLIVAYNYSDNVYIYDASTKDILDIIDVGEGPEDLFITDDHIYVCCIWSSEIIKISLNSHAVLDIISVGSYPAEIRVNSDESIVYIGMVKNPHTNGGYNYGYGHLAAYDLSTHDEIFTNHDIYFDVMNKNVYPVGRRMYTYTDFFLINNDQEIAAKLNHSMKLCILDAQTGIITDSMNIHPCSMVIKPGSDSLYLVDIADSNLGLNFYIMDVQNHQFIDSIKENTNSQPITYYYAEFLKVDNTGKKLFAEIDGGFFEPAGFLANFENHTIKEYPLLHLWFGARLFSDVSYDGRFVMLPHDWFAIFDFQEENYVYDNLIGDHMFSKCIAASPLSYECVWHDYYQNTIDMQYLHDEYIGIVDFTNPYEPDFSDSIICGVQPEADYMYSATFNAVHNKIITANASSKGISIIDAETYTVDTIIEIERLSLIENISDDLVAIGGSGCDTLYILDLTNLSVICRLPTPFRLKQIISVPGNECFFTFNKAISTAANIRKYIIDGANTNLVESLQSGFSFMQNSLDRTYFPEVTPDGEYLMYLNENLFTLLHIDKMEIECTIPIDIKLQGMACSDDSQRVGLVHGIDAGTITIIYLNGPDSFLEHQVYTIWGGYAVEYNPHDQMFYMSRVDDVITVDPRSGTIEDTLDLVSPNWPFEIGFDPDGEPIVVSSRHLFYNDEIFLTKEMPQSFMVDTIRNICFFVTTGPDKVYCLDFETTDLIEIPTYKPTFEVEVYPNPADEYINIRSSVDMTRVVLTGIDGKKVFDQQINGKQQLLNTDGLKSGIYIVEVMAGKQVESRKVIIKH